jgi:hypothetical protein
MAKAATSKTTPGEACPQCHALAESGDRFCRNCGHRLRDDELALEAQLARMLPAQIEAALANRFKDQKIVEMETAEKLAERAMGWLKLLGFFVGIPILLFGAALSFLGIKTYTGIESAMQKATRFEALVSNAEKQFGGVQKRVNDFDTTLANAQKQINEKIAQLGSEQQKLQTQVANIQERLRFCPSKGLTSDLKTTLQDKLGKYIERLEKIGFQNLETQISVCIYSKDEPALGDVTSLNAFYMQQERTVYIHRDLAFAISVALREYGHHALLAVLPKAQQEVRDSEVESALADYFAASFLDDPLLGENTGKLFGMTTSYIRNLATASTYAAASAESHARGEIWGAALWQCRRELGTDTVDKISLQAWKDFNNRSVKPENLKSFSAALVAGEAATGNQGCFLKQITQRGLPH